MDSHGHILKNQEKTAVPAPPSPGLLKNGFKINLPLERKTFYPHVLAFVL